MHCPICGRRTRASGCPEHGAPAGFSVSLSPGALASFDTAPTLPGYRVIGPLGGGGLATVYAAEGPEGDVAIKTAHRARPMAAERLRLEAEAPRLSTLVPVAPALDEVVRQCLAKSPGERPVSAAAVRQALES